MATLNEKDRRAIVLRFYEGRSLREVGAALGGNDESAKKRVARAVEKLQRYFSKRGVHSTTTIIAGAISENSVHTAPPALTVTVTAVAIAKGAAASVSTLSLVKGVLTMMGWAKAKKAAVAGGCVLVIAGMGILAFSIFGPWRAVFQPDLQGAWEGSMLLEYDAVGAGQAARTHMVLHLVKTHGSYTATVDWIELGRRNVPAGKVTYDYPYLRIQRNPTDMWEFRINADATQMVLPHWIHFTVQDPVMLVRTSLPDTVRTPLAGEEFASGDGSSLQGYWEGEFNFNGKEAAPVNLKIADQGNGTFHAEVGWPEFGLEGLPATVQSKGGLVKFTDDIGNGLFQGAMNDAGTELIGSWTQAGVSVPAKFKRADYHAEPTTDDEKDYSFTSPNELQGHWRGAWNVTIVKTKATVQMALDIAKLPGGSYSAVVWYAGNFERYRVSPSDFHYDPPNVSLEWKWAGLAYKGSLTNSELVGVWSQSGFGFPLILKRADQ